MNTFSPKHRPPKLGQWLLQRIIHSEYRYSALGDFEEIYAVLVEESGAGKAWLWYWTHVVRSIPAFVIDLVYWSVIMLKNYFKIAFRILKRHKGYSFINIAGLAIGLTAVILILLYIQFELSFDRYHNNAGRIYRVMRGQQGSGRLTPITPAPLGPALEAEFPEVVTTARFNSNRNVHISYGNKNYFENGFYFADPSTFDIFSFELLKGNPETALSNPYSIVISAATAEKYFGNENPLGKTIIYKGTQGFKVTGILKNLPENSHFTINFLVPFETLEKIYARFDIKSWGINSFYTYVLLSDDANPLELENKTPELAVKYMGEDEAKKGHFSFQPLTKIHLTAKLKIIIYLFSSIATLILIIACINYMNLATARSVQRMKEIGIRKVVGASRAQLIKQFLGESTIFTILSFLLAILMVWIFLPSFDALVERNLNFAFIENSQFLLWLFALVMFVGIFAGSWPALAVSSIKPTTIFNDRAGYSKGSLLRNILVVTQFSISIILIVATLVINEQLNFIQTTDVGFQKEQIVVVDIRDKKFRNNIETISTEFRRHPNILSVASSNNLPNEADMATLANWPGKADDRKQQIYINFVDYDFIDLYEIELVEGRSFSRDFPADVNGAFLLNEAAVKEIGWESAVGKELTHYINRRTGKIVGIVKDFHMLSLHESIEPLCIDLNPGDADTYLSVKITGADIPKTILFIKETLAKVAPNYPFKYSFFDEIFDQAYKLEQKLASIFSVFALLAILVASLGLFGLASFTAAQRTKEIGIRKVLGASVAGIILMLSKEFTRRVLLANIIAWPVAYFALNRWLESFAYKVDIGLWSFVLSGALALFVALVTLSYQAVKSAVANPVEALRYE